MIKNLLITGAGVDCTKGIEFPMAATLLPEIAAYIEGGGKSVDQTLRSLLPNLRFTFASMVARAVDAISTRGADAQRAMVQRVQNVIDEMQGKTVTIVGPGVHDDSFLKHMEKVFHIPQANLGIDNDSETSVQKSESCSAPESLRRSDQYRRAFRVQKLTRCLPTSMKPAKRPAQSSAQAEQHESVSRLVSG